MRVRQDEKIARLESVPLFSGLRRRELEKVARLCTRTDAAAGAVLCREGSAGHEFFVILEGTADVTIAGKTVNKMGPGDFFGELALLDAGPRVATVTASAPLIALVLTSSEFRTLLNDEPQVAVRLLPAIGQRLRSMRAAT